MLKAILFDLDDTLIDWSGFDDDWTFIEHKHLSGVFDYVNTTHPLEDDLSTFAAEVRNRTLAQWSKARHTLGAPNLGKVLIESAVALGVPNGALDMRRCLEAYHWGVVHGTRVFPDVPASLAALRDAGLRFGIITNAYQPMWQRDLELAGLGLLDFFPECRFSAADFGVLKPHESIFRAALECLNLPPSEVVFIGDDPDADVSGAQGVGMKAILRASRALSYDGVIPNAVIDRLDELPMIFDQWYPGWRH